METVIFPSFFQVLSKLFSRESSSFHVPFEYDWTFSTNYSGTMTNDIKVCNSNPLPSWSKELKDIPKVVRDIVKIYGGKYKENEGENA